MGLRAASEDVSAKLAVLLGACLIAAACLLASAPPLVSAQDLPQAALVVSAVRPVDGHGCASYGSALSVGDGLFLTAAHVLLDPADLAGDCRLGAVSREAVAKRKRPFSIKIALPGGAAVDAAVAAKGVRVATPDHAMSFTGSGDFGIIRVAAPVRASPALEPCGTPAEPGQAVVVVLRGGPVRTTVAVPQTAKTGDDVNYVDLAELFSHGTSGAGVLDAATHCVLGVISHRYPEPHPTVTRMTPVTLFADAWRRARGG